MKNLFLLTFLIIATTACSPTTTGNPVKPNQAVALRMEDEQPFALIKKASDLIIPNAHAAITNAKFCFKRLRFKPDASTPGSNVDLTLGQIDINPAGTNLLTVYVPEGRYERIEFDLDKECDGVPGKPSVEFTNDNGSFTTLESMTIKFDGVYTVNAAGTLTLNIDSLFDAMDIMTNNNQIKVGLENAPGDF
jgi:hypothetical protein